MTDNDILEAVERAKSLVADYDEPYRSIAFKVLLERLLGAAVPAQEQVPTRAIVPHEKGSRLPLSMGLNEFLASKGVETHVQRVVAMAYFNYQQGDPTGITTRDIAEAYAKTRLKKPQNIPDVIASCVRNGFLIDSDPKDGMKAWVITGTGERHVEEF